MTERDRPQPPSLIRAVLPITLLSLYVPLIAMLAYSFVGDQPGETPTVRWYSELFADSTLWWALARSLVVSLLASAASAALGTLAALALDRWVFPARTALRALSSVSLMLPELVLGLSLLSWFALVGVPLSLWTVTVAHVTLTLPFSLLVVGARVRALDRSYEDAARDLGASEAQILWRVTLPMLRPAIVSAYLLSLMISFDDFLVTFFTSGVGSDLLPVRLYSLMKTGLSPKVLALSSLMFIASTILVFMVVRRRTLRESIVS